MRYTTSAPVTKLVLGIAIAGVLSASEVRADVFDALQSVMMVAQKEVGDVRGTIEVAQAAPDAAIVDASDIEDIEPAEEVAAPAADEADAVATEVLPELGADEDLPELGADNGISELGDDGLGDIEELEPVEEDDNNISLTLEEVPINDVIQMFTRLSGADIILPGTGVTDRVSLNIRDRNWRDALDIILATVDMVAIETERDKTDRAGILIVVPSAQVASMEQRLERGKPLVTKIIQVNYADPIDLVKQVVGLKILSSRGTITTTQSAGQSGRSMKIAMSAGGNNPSLTTAVVVKDIAVKVEQVEALIRKIDVLEPQVFIEARILDVNRSHLEQIGMQWNVLGEGGLNWSPIGETYDRLQTRDKTVAGDRSRTRGDTGANIRDPISGGVTATRTLSDTLLDTKSVSRVVDDALQRTLFESRAAVLGPLQANFLLDYLMNDSTIDEISHPMIVVGNKVEAKIHVGETRAIISVEENEGEGGSESVFTEAFTEVEVGLTLWVIPEIANDSSMVRLSINPDISVLVEEIRTERGAVFPVVSSRSMQTRVNVPSGHTVVVGGLKEVRVRKVNNRLPVLGDLPLLGRFFAHDNDNVITKNLLILLSPTILDVSNPQTGLERQAQADVEFLEGHESDLYHERSEQVEEHERLKEGMEVRDKEKRTSRRRGFFGTRKNEK